MKLFQRTLLSFVGIIMLQGALTIVLVADSIESAQSVDAWRELSNESVIVYDNVNAWKRLLWKESVGLLDDAHLASLIAAQTTVAFDSRLDDYIASAGARTGIDILIARSGYSRFTSVKVLSGKPLPAPGEENFVNRKEHPYIDTLLLNNTLYFVGIVRIHGSDTRFIDFFLIKQIDEGLCAQLNFNPRIRSLVSAGPSYSVGSIGGSSFTRWLDGHPMTNSWAAIENIEQDGIPYSAIVQQSGMARLREDGGETETAFYITTFFSRSEYRQRLSTINQRLLLVSLVIACFTLVVSLGLAETITFPIRRLRKAMHAVKAGKFDTTVEGKPAGEIGDLLRGFNEMATQLEQDRTALGEYISEIVRLKEYNEKIFDSIREGIVVVNAVFNVEKANHAFLEYFGQKKEDVEGRNIDELSIALFDAPLHMSVQAVLTGSLPFDVQVRRTPAGVSFEVKLYPLFEASRPEGDRFHCIMIIEDVSRRIAFEEGIFQAEKLAGISMLSAGVAHEINNPLSSILTNVQNLLAAEGEEPKRADLRIIETETRRIARIVRGLLDFSAAGENNPDGIDMNAVIGEVLNLVQYSIKNKSRISIQTELSGDLPPVAVGKDEFKQITINLINNSLQAIESGGIITLRTAATEDGRSVEFSVSDTGSGITAEILPRIFDPFFTTKGNDGNTGLGLSVVYGIVTKYRGSITAESGHDTGATMRILLPAKKA